MTPSPLPFLPLLLWDTPPGLELILAQEGIAFKKVSASESASIEAGRFVLFDSRRVSLPTISSRISSDHQVIDIDQCRRDEPFDPFEALIDQKAAVAEWTIGRALLKETVSRRAKGIIRKRLVECLRSSVLNLGGIWATLSPYPFPYQSAFNFRADLDEENPEDYFRFAKARNPIDDCVTHFVSTFAYSSQKSVLSDLRRLDTQSHGHFHHVYDDHLENQRNLERAHAILVESAFEPRGFAAPHGRWTLGLDACLESLGYEYSSDFQLGYDDLPFFPWLGERFSTVLQIPIHPVCEGLFLDAGNENGQEIGDYFVSVVRSKIDNHEPAFVYGHPERRLARFPEILRGLAEAIADSPRVWRVTLTEFAAWWKFRASQDWTLKDCGDGVVEFRREGVTKTYSLGLEIWRKNQRSILSLTQDQTRISLDQLTYETKQLRFDHPVPRAARSPFRLKDSIRRAIDWETVTPLESLASQTPAQRLKRRIRLMKATASKRGSS